MSRVQSSSKPSGVVASQYAVETGARSAHSSNLLYRYYYEVSKS